MTSLESSVDVIVGSPSLAGVEVAPRSAISIYAGTFLVAGASLAVEVTLTRIFSFTIWYHFAYLSLNAALLGFCSSGVAASIWSAGSVRRSIQLICAAALLSAATLLLFLLCCAGHPLEPDSLFREPGGFAGGLALYYLGIALPFFFSGAAIVLSLSLMVDRVAKIYFADLAGAGAGALASLGGMWLAGPPLTAFACVPVLILAGGFYGLAASRRVGGALILFALLAFVALPFGARVDFRPARSTYVGLYQARPADFKPIHSEWNAITRVDVYHPTTTDDWSFPQWTYDGRSEKYALTPETKPGFYGMFYDAHNRSDIYRVDPDGKTLEFLDYHLLKTPYVVLKPQPRVLVMGAGGGIDVLNAYRNGASSIVAVELQPIVVNLLSGELSGWVGGRFSGDPRVRLVAQEGRNFLKQDQGRYDLIQFVATDTWAAQNTGAYVLTESYLYSQEAITEYWQHLTDDGILCLIVWDPIKEQKPYRQPINAKLMLQYLNVMGEQHVAEPQNHLVILGKPEYYGSVFTVPLLKKSAFTEQEVADLRDFAGRMGFSVIYAPFGPNEPGMLPRLITASPESRESMLGNSLYRIVPTTDDNPFFFYIFRWGHIFGIDHETWTQPMTGQLVLLVMLGQGALFALIGLGLPLLIHHPTSACTAPTRLRFLAFFLAIGIGYMFVEIAMIQKFIVLLGYPAYAFATIMFSLLAASGLGSYATTRLRSPHLLRIAVAFLAVAIVAINIGTPVLVGALLGTSFPLRILASILATAPIGFILGMFMPIGLSTIVSVDSRLLPWAWAVNGVGSVLSTVLAILLAMSAGFRVVLFVALAIYLVAALVLPARLMRTAALSAS